MTRPIEAIEAEIADLTGRLEAAEAERAEIAKAKILASLPACEGQLLDMLAEAIAEGGNGCSNDRRIGEWTVTIMVETDD